MNTPIYILEVDGRTYVAEIEQDDDGAYIGEVHSLLACHTCGDTLEELLENLREVINMCLEELQNESR